MLSVSELKAIRYSISSYFHGVKVLRNPKGTPSTVVRTIDYGRSIDDKTLDVWEGTTRITRDFAKPEEAPTVENFVVNIYNFFNKENKKIKSLRAVEYSRTNPDGTSIRKPKGNLSTDELKSRDLTNLHTPSIKRRILVNSFYSNDVISSYQHAVPMEVNESFAKVECERFDRESETIYNRIYNSGDFIKTLWYNIVKNK